MSEAFKTVVHIIVSVVWGTAGTEEGTIEADRLRCTESKKIISYWRVYFPIGEKNVYRYSIMHNPPQKKPNSAVNYFK